MANRCGRCRDRGEHKNPTGPGMVVCESCGGEGGARPKKPEPKAAKKASPISPASQEQRVKVRNRQCIYCGRDSYETTVHPAHLVDRSIGGCDHPDCVVPLCAHCHRLYDDGKLDLLPTLITQRRLRELQHALGHYNGDLLGLLQRVTNERYVTESARRAA